MSSIQFYLFGPSPPCRSVYMTAKALRVPLDLKYVDLVKGEHMGKEFTQINPLHKVPTIIDGDLVLWESRAIMRYLVGKFGDADNSLYPWDVKTRAIIDQLLDHDLGTFYKTIFEDLMAPLRLKTPMTKEMEERIAKSFEWLDLQVKGKKYLTGNDLTIADFAAVVGFAANVIYKDGVAKYPHAVSWFKRMKELPYYKEINQPFSDFVDMLKKAAADK